MRVSRVYLPVEINTTNHELIINKNDYNEQYNYISKVLRLKIKYQVIIFNNTGYDFICQIKEITNQIIKLIILEKKHNNSESSFQIHLAQAISKPSHFELTLQKAIELGVSEITPIITEYSEQLKKKDRLNKIIISACEQSNRSIIPKLNPETTIDNFLKNHNKNIIMPTPRATQKLDINIIKNDTSATLLIGPEGGFSEKEEFLAEKNKINSITLGPRILRTETAGITLISILQFLKGDL